MMEYVTYEQYKALYGDKAIPEGDFTRLSWEACKKAEYATTGVDGFNKLKEAFPTDEDDVEAVRRCISRIVTIMAEIEQAEESARNASGFVTREDGTVQSKLVASVSSGSESISYATSSSGAKNSLIGAVLTDKAAQEKLYADTFSEYLSGVLDANGVNLLFMGAYPCVRKR